MGHYDASESLYLPAGHVAPLKANGRRHGNGWTTNHNTTARPTHPPTERKRRQGKQRNGQRMRKRNEKRRKKEKRKYNNKKKGRYRPTLRPSPVLRPVPPTSSLRLPWRRVSNRGIDRCRFFVSWTVAPSAWWRVASFTTPSSTISIL